MIELQHLSAGYPDGEILKPVNLVIPDGQLTIVIGPNGSGKSTLLKTIAGILPPIGGNVFLRNVRNETVLSPTERAQFISYLPQSRNTPEISGYRMVLHGRFPYLGWPRRYRDCDHEAAEQAMKQAGCWELRDRRLPDLSGGERQKIYIAMILAQDTPNILMDEPTTWLDIGHQLKLMDISRKLAGRGRCVVMVLHDLSLALRYADKLILIHGHEISPLMTPEELFESRRIDEAFCIRLCRVKTENGWQYYCM